MSGASWTASMKAEEVAALLPFLLLVLALFFGRPNRIRGMVGLAALAGLAHAFHVGKMQLPAAGWGAVLLVSLLLVGHRLRQNRSVRFTSEEQEMVGRLLTGLSPFRTRHLLDQGFWLTGKAGDTLTREDEPVSHLFYLASGEAKVLSHGRQVGTCHAGDLIGEVAVLSGDQASATVVLSGPARFWCAPADVLRPYLNAHEDVRRALEHGFAESLRTKLRASNQAIFEAGGIAA